MSVPRDQLQEVMSRGEESYIRKRVSVASSLHTHPFPFRYFLIFNGTLN